MKYCIKLITCFVLFIISAAYLYSAETKILSKEELFDIYSNKLRELNLTTVDMKNIRLEEFGIVYNANEDGRKIPGVFCKNAGFGMDIDPYSGRILSCYNHSIEDKMCSVVFKGGAKPSRDKEGIIKEAERYLKILYGDNLEDIVFNNATYSVGIWPKEGYSYEGSWALNWKRKTDGYLFYRDGIGMGVHEKYGLFVYNYGIFSQYHPPKKINITKEKSIEIAKKNINKIMHAYVFGGWYDMFKAGEINSVEMMIVNPNYVHISKIFIPAEKSKNAKLAWVVRFNCMSKKENHPVPRPPIEVWIDAETGEVLGGG